jgi:hypothetical protein
MSALRHRVAVVGRAVVSLYVESLRSAFSLRTMTLAAALFVGGEGIAETIEKMAIFNFAAFGLLGVGPQQGVGFGIEERDTCVSLGNFAGVGRVDGGVRRKLAIGKGAHVIAVIEAKDEVGFFRTVCEVEVTPLVYLKDEVVLEFVETGVIDDKNSVSANHGIGQIFGGSSDGLQDDEEQQGEQESRRDGERIPVHRNLQKIGNGGFTVVR